MPWSSAACENTNTLNQALAVVQDAAGHANVSITSIYLHVLVDDEEDVGDLFGVVCKQSLGE